MIENVFQFSQCQLAFSVFTRTSSLIFFSLGQFCRCVAAKKKVMKTKNELNPS